MKRLKFNIADTPLAGLKVIKRQPIEDARGFFCRVFCAEDLHQAGFYKPIAQANHTLTHQKGTVRGLHFQYPPHAEMKLVSCLRGEVYDVAVDLRRESPTFLQWHAEILSDNNFKSMLIPEGFAHGFQALSTDCELFYLHTEYYHPASVGALNAKDPSLGITWPMEIKDISARDLDHPMINKLFGGISL
jgi:dTDP-4-dehydrorhamnose 3,5-epimerase